MTTLVEWRADQRLEPAEDAASTITVNARANGQNEGSRAFPDSGASSPLTFAELDCSAQPLDDFIDERRRSGASEVRRNTLARPTAPDGVPKSRNVQSKLGSLSQVRIIPLGRHGHDRFAFWRIDSGTVEVLGAHELGKHQGLQRLAQTQDWELWAGGQDCFKPAMASNALINECIAIGEVDLGLVPTSICEAEAVSLAWHKACVRLSGGATPGRLATLLLALPEWNGSIYFDELALAPACDKTIPSGGPIGHLTDKHDELLAAYLDQFAVAYPTSKAPELFSLLADKSRRHPIRDYLQSLCWDGQPRLDDALVRLAGSKDTDYTRKVFAKTLIAACARACMVSSKVDTALTLEGDQGSRKSSFFLALMPDSRWLSEGLGGTIGQKDAAQGLIGKWFVELPELTAMKRVSIEQFKEFMTKQTDYLRLPYGRRFGDFNRTCIFVATVNPDADGSYLRDASGNRRFWPVSVTLCDVDGVAAERDQLWAEAYTRYKAGEKYWFDQDDEALAAVEQAARLEANPWDDHVVDCIQATRRDWITVAEVFEQVTDKKMTTRDLAESKKIAAALKAIGWKQASGRFRGKRYWIKPGASLPSEDDERPL